MSGYFVNARRSRLLTSAAGELRYTFGGWAVRAIRMHEPVSGEGIDADCISGRSKSVGGAGCAVRLGRRETEPGRWVVEDSPRTQPGNHRAHPGATGR